MTLAVVKRSGMRLVNSVHTINHHCCKTAPIFTMLTHNTSIDSLNYHACFDLQKIPGSHQTKKKMPRLSRRSNCPGVTIFICLLVCDTLYTLDI